MSAVEVVGTISSGTLLFDRLKNAEHEYAVLQGHSFEDTEHVYAIKFDKTSGDEYFINMKTREKSWTLPTSINTDETNDLMANPWRQRFIAFYEKYSPDRIPFIDPTLLQHPGREEILMKALVRKYGPEPGHEHEDDSNVVCVEENVGAQSETENSKFRDRVIALIQYYKPSKLPLVDKYLEKYSGQEEELIQFLINKFGPEPQAELISNANTSHVLSSNTVLQEKSTLLRESALLGFLQDREARLEAALTRNADLTSELMSLREQNEGLMKEARDMRGLIESESKRIEGDLLRVQNANAVAAQHWEVERTALLSQLQSEATIAQQQLTQERLKYQESCAIHFKEKGSLLEDFQRNKEELEFCQRKTSDLLSALDKKEVLILKLQKEHEVAVGRLNSLRVSSSTQTSPEDIGETSPLTFLSPTQQEAVNTLKKRISVLENTIQRIKFDCQQHSHVSQQLQGRSDSLDSLTFNSGGCPSSPSSLQLKLSKAHATISALRSLNKSMEERVNVLELKLLSQPPVFDTQDDESLATSLQEKLVVSESTVKAQRKEINDLRGLLARYMSAQKKKTLASQ